MSKIGLISDTHGTFDEALKRFLEPVDEIWHAGDIGSVETGDLIAAFRPLRAVCGNIDRRGVWPLWQCFTVEGLDVAMTHIGGYPGHYDPRALARIEALRPRLFIAGHSHILKVMNDPHHDLLHINPGAAGLYGIHKVRTAVRFSVSDGVITDLEVGEWNR